MSRDYIYNKPFPVVEAFVAEELKRLVGTIAQTKRPN